MIPFFYWQPRGRFTADTEAAIVSSRAPAVEARYIRITVARMQGSEVITSPLLEDSAKEKTAARKEQRPSVFTLRHL